MKRIMLMIGIVALMATFSFGTTDTTFARNERRESGPHWMRFYRGEAIIGGTVVYDLGSGKMRVWYDCGIAVATHDGRLRYGAAGAYPSELAKLPSCTNTWSNPGLRKDSNSLENKPMTVRPGHRVIADIFEIGSSRRTYFNCYFLVTPNPGRILVGVRDPYPRELSEQRKLRKRCEDTVPNPGPKLETGDGGTLHFMKGDKVLGALIRLSDGRTFESCHFVAPMNGEVTGGVVNYYPGWDSKLPSCTN